MPQWPQGAAQLSPKTPPEPSQAHTGPQDAWEAAPHTRSSRGGVRSHVSTAAIDILADLPTVLPQLRLLELHHSQIAPAQTHALARALTFFSSSLEELKLDCWPCAALDAEAAEQEFRHVALNRVLLDGICRLSGLKVLTLPDWGVVVAGSVEALDARKLAVLKGLESVFVAGYPCATCTDSACCHFPGKLQYKSLQ